MTRDEARAFIEEAEQLHPSEIDPDKLAEAIRVLSDAQVDLDPLFEGLARFAGNLKDSLNENLLRSRSAMRALGEAVGDAVGKVAGPVAGVVEDVGRIQTAGPRFGSGDYLARAGQLATQISEADQLPDDATPSTSDPATSSPSGETSQEGQVPTVRVDPGGFSGGVGGVTGTDGGLPAFPEPPPGPGPPPIGVPVDFVAQREIPAGLGATRPGDPTQTLSRKPRYVLGDELAPQSLDPTAIIRLQKRLVAAGLLDEGTYYAGYWTDVSEAAYKTVLGVANTNGTSATVALSELIRSLPQSVKDQRARAKRLEQFQAPPYIKPDFATLAQDVKTTMRTRLRREPTAAELAELTREMTGLARQGFDAFTEEQRLAFNRAQGIQPSVTADNVIRPMGVVSGGLTVAPTEVQDVDAAARFREFFEKRFKPEIDRLVSLDEVRRNTTNVFASLRTMSSLIGGR